MEYDVVIVGGGPSDQQQQSLMLTSMRDNKNLQKSFNCDRK